MTPQDFKTWRKALKLTQAGAAAALGLSKLTIQMYEAGKRYDDGRPVVIPLTVQLACAALAHGLTPADALRR